LVLTTHALLELASVDYREGNYETARSQAEEALGMAQGIGDKGRIGMALGLLAEVAWAQGDYGNAHVRAEASLPILEEGGRLPQIAWAQRNLAYAALGKGDITRAVTLFQESLRVFSEHEVRLGIASCVAGLGNVALQCEQPRLAARLFGAVNAMLDTANAQFAPADQNAYQHGITDAQAALGPQTFSDEWKVGQGLNLDQTVQAALAVVNELDTGRPIDAPLTISDHNP
jgi:tetratricopeptide (TPR) repeat protein